MSANPPSSGGLIRLDQTILVTGNPDKLAEAERICGRPLRHAAVDLPEIQSSSLAEVAHEKAQEAWRRLRQPVIVDETGLELSALNGFPGPLIKFMLDAIGPAGVARTANALGDDRASAVCLLMLYDGRETVSGEGRTDGRLVLTERGDNGFGFDKVLVPDGESRTYAELSGERKDAIGHRGRAWRALLAELARSDAEPRSRS